ncbi:hypothetical protein PybrP1_011076 [[Pythium] brassicae (nom. inval.)]|nr:hypothetical protein PybrP1_011076 [[Pythium] brassicae (nom. inval.)]
MRSSKLKLSTSRRSRRVGSRCKLLSRCRRGGVYLASDANAMLVYGGGRCDRDEAFFSGRECDLGAIADILRPKCASLRSGFTEGAMMLQLNNHLIPPDVRTVKHLSNSSWMDHIPKRNVDTFICVANVEHHDFAVLRDENGLVARPAPRT